MPFLPHCGCVVPSWQVLPTQQPGQVDLHIVLTHEPLVHTSPLLHAAQVAPLIPHVALTDATHAPVAVQHPAQLLGPHGCLHTPAAQVAPVPAQVAQRPPPPPHAPTAVPGWQLSASSQQPDAQVVGPQLGGDVQTRS